jgi:hypothetical protein
LQEQLNEIIPGAGPIVKIAEGNLLPTGWQAMGPASRLLILEKTAAPRHRRPGRQSV